MNTFLVKGYDAQGQVAMVRFEAQDYSQAECRAELKYKMVEIESIIKI